MTNRPGGQWSTGGVDDTTGHAPGWQGSAGPGGPDLWRTDHGTAGPQYDAWAEAPDRRASSTRSTALVVTVIVAALLIVGLLAAMLVLLATRGGETSAAGGAVPVAGGQLAPAPAGGETWVPTPQDPAAGSHGSDGAGSSGQGEVVDRPVGGGSGGESDTAPASGSYVGVLHQRGTRRSDRDYTVEMTFSSQGSSIVYPALGCRGTLTPTGDANGSRVYRETITSGGCDSTGNWYVTRGSDRAISVEYHPAGDDYVVVGQLTR